MAITINGSGTIGGVSVGGLPDGIVDTDMLASAAVEQAKLASNVAGNGPTFLAYRGGSQQGISPNTWTKIQFNNESWDTHNCYDNSTNYRFTPTVAGYYQLNAGAFISGSSITFYAFQIKVNGLQTFLAPHQSLATTSSDIYTNHSAVGYFNGSTDYAEAYAYVSASGINLRDGNTYPNKLGCYFSAAMIRAA